MRLTSRCDLDCDGLPDLLEATSYGWLVRRNLGDGKFSTPVPIAGFAVARRVTGPARDEWTRLADTTCDGLTDWVWITRGSIEVYQALGHGRFADPRC